MGAELPPIFLFRSPNSSEMGTQRRPSTLRSASSATIAISQSAAPSVSPPRAIATHCQAAMAVTLNPPHTAPSRETDSAEPRAVRQHAAAVVTIKLRYKKDPSDMLRLSSLTSNISELSSSSLSSKTHSEHSISIGQS